MLVRLTVGIRTRITDDLLLPNVVAASLIQEEGEREDRALQGLSTGPLSFREIELVRRLTDRCRASAASTIAERRQRMVSGENGSMNGIPFALRSGLPSRITR